MNTLEVTIKEFSTNGGTCYKVTKKIPLYGVSETKMFKAKKEAKKYFEKCLDEVRFRS